MKLTMTARKCPVCASFDSRLFATEDFDPEKWDSFAFASRKVPEYMHYRLVECGRCDLLYANPAPDGGLLADAYREATYDSAEEAKSAARTYASFLPSITPKLRQKGAALDIGAGDGAFLEQLLVAGFSAATGVEPSTAPIESAKPEIRPHIRQGLFCSSDFAGESFSLVSCFQTIEHVQNPGQMLAEINSLLEEKGAIFIVCHNRRALSARALGLKSPIFDIEHLQLFSRKSLHFALEAAGFVDIRIHAVRNRYTLSYWSRLFPLPKPLKEKILRFLAGSPLGALQISLPAGNLAAIGHKRGP